MVPGRFLGSYGSSVLLDTPNPKCSGFDLKGYSDSDYAGCNMDRKSALGFDLKGYSDSDYAGCNMDRKSALGVCQILGGKLVYWSAKK
nr:retrovirus-related Pol polyprotein from transposon TNT 1-94 [Tanacetum cinerariifolium]